MFEFPFLSDSITNDVVVPLQTKIKRKSKLEAGTKFVAKHCPGLVGAGLRGEHDFSHKREMIGRNPREG
jgi:hypothetical protein